MINVNLTEQLCSISACYPHQLFLATGMIWQIWRDVVYFAVNSRPSIFFLIVRLEHGRWDAQEGLHTLVCHWEW